MATTKRFVVCLLVIGLVLCVQRGALAQGDEPTAKVFFTRFVMTYEPMRMRNFEKESDYELHFFGEHEFIKELVGSLEEATDRGDFEDNVRLKLVILGSKNVEYYVDQRGVVQKDKAVKFSLSREKMRWIEERIRNFHGVVDARPTVSPKY